MSKPSVPQVVANSEIEDFVKSLKINEQFDLLLKSARLSYEYAKIKHNEELLSLSTLERLRISVETLEGIGPTARKVLTSLPRSGRGK
jgi:hypothetical protein